MQDQGAADLAEGLQTATQLKRLHLNWKQMIDVEWTGAGMSSLMAALRSRPIEDATIRLDSRATGMPSDFAATLVSNMPQLKSLHLQLDNSKLTDDAVAALMVALPRTLEESFILNVQNNPFSSEVATALTEGVDRLSNVRDVKVDFMSCRSISSEAKVAMFTALKAEGLEECSLKCEEIKDINTTIANQACAGSGNCKTRKTPAPPTEAPTTPPGAGGLSREAIYAITTTALVLGASVLGYFVTKSFRRADTEVRKPVLVREHEFGYVPPEQFGDRKDD